MPVEVVVLDGDAVVVGAGGKGWVVVDEVFPVGVAAVVAILGGGIGGEKTLGLVYRLVSKDARGATEATCIKGIEFS